MSEIVYSAQKSGFEKGREYQNPRFFDGVLKPGATSAIVVGDWPKVTAAYEAAGIPVRQVKPGGKLPSPNSGGDDNVSREVTTDHPLSVVKGKGKDAGKIEPPLKKGNNFEVPENFKDMSWRELQAVLSKMPDAPDLSSKKAAIEYLDQVKDGKIPPAGDQPDED